MGAGTSAGDATGPQARPRAGTAPSAAPAEPQGPAEPLEPAAKNGTAAQNGTAASAAGAVPEEEVPATTARPEGSGRAAAPDAPAPVRQWPLISVLGTTGLGLLIVGLHPFDEAFRIGTMLIGVALIGGAVLRRTIPSVGMLAVRSRFTDMVTYGLLGIAIVLLALMTQPDPWLEFPFLEDVVHSTVKTPTP